MHLFASGFRYWLLVQCQCDGMVGINPKGVEWMKELNIKQLSKQTTTGFQLCLKQLTLRQGHIYGIVGLNGAGKTTFLKCLCGLLQIDRGSVTSDNHLIDLSAPSYLAQLGTNFVDGASLATKTV